MSLNIWSKIFNLVVYVNWYRLIYGFFNVLNIMGIYNLCLFWILKKWNICIYLVDKFVKIEEGFYFKIGIFCMWMCML